MRRESGEDISGKDVKKHRNDVFRLLQLLAAGETVELPDALTKDMISFVEAVAKEGALVPKDIGLAGSLHDQLTRLRGAYAL